MRRRELVAGLGSLGLLGTAGLAYVGRLPSTDQTESFDPVAIRTVEAAGSAEGELTLPAEGGVTFVDLFATTCRVCQAQMPALGEAAEQVGPDVTFVSLTREADGQVSDEHLAQWWADHDGHWTVGRDESWSFVRHFTPATPTAVVFDPAGRLVAEETGRKSADEILALIDAADG